MPKIIKDLETRLIEETKRQIQEAGYAAVTIRSVSKSCGVGVGTVYNYFPSKEALVATYLLADWNQCLTVIQAVCADAETPRQAALCIYEQLVAFSNRHSAVFRDEAAAAGFAGSFSQYHSLLRNQIAKPLQRFCRGAFAADFIAESLLTWTVTGKDFDSLYEILEKLF